MAGALIAYLQLDQSVFTVLPSKPGIRPGMVLVFELFLLRGAVVPTDRVVGWGCFPITDAQFEIVEGKWVELAQIQTQDYIQPWVKFPSWGGIPC